MSYYEAKKFANSLGVDPFWCWDMPRTREGYYRYNGGTKCAINRGLAFAPYGDIVWMETAKPCFNQAKEFAEGILLDYPDIFLCYNLSPSFNWDKAGMTDEQIGTFIKDLGKIGFVWQFITLAGLHSNALVVDSFAKDFANRGMLAYVETIQRQERKLGVEVLAHQKWAGADYVDSLVKTVTGGISSTAATGKGITEVQF